MKLENHDEPNLEELEAFKHLESTERGLRLLLLLRAFLGEATVICAPRADSASAALLLASSLQGRPLSIFAAFKERKEHLDRVEGHFALQRLTARETREREIAEARSRDLSKETGI